MNAVIAPIIGAAGPNLDAQRVSLDEAKEMQRAAIATARSLNIYHCAAMIAETMGDASPADYVNTMRYEYSGRHAGRDWQISYQKGLDKRAEIVVDGDQMFFAWSHRDFHAFRDGEWIKDFGSLYGQAMRRRQVRAVHAKRSDVLDLLLRFAPANARILQPE